MRVFDFYGFMILTKTNNFRPILPANEMQL